MVRLLRLTIGVAAAWGAYGALITPYIYIRSLGADLLAWHDGGRIERAVMYREPTRLLQDSLYDGTSWIDYSGFLLHMSWFFAPIAVSLLVSLFERRRLFELFGWLVACSHLANIGFLLLPLRPPWMEAGIHRILEERAFVEYVGVDNNPVAAFPSLHAAIPMVMGLFLLLRCQKVRQVGWVLVVYALLVGLAVVYLGEHWVIDVVAGYALAGGVAVLFMHPASKRASRRVPGDPIGWLQDFERRLLLLGRDGPVPATPEQMELPRAA
jgi:membrane-associated phospholipid phosphatase